MPTVLLQRSDGGVSVSHLVPTLDPEQAFERTVAQWEENERVAALQRPGYVARTIVSTRAIEPSDLPASRRWRDAWRDDGKVVVVDLAEAKKIRAAELEREQVALLKATAKDHMIAFAKGDEVAAAAARQKVQALDALDKAAIEASVANVADLDALEKHEPQPIKDAKPVKSVVTDGIAVEPR